MPLQKNGIAFARLLDFQGLSAPRITSAPMTDIVYNRDELIHKEKQQFYRHARSCAIEISRYGPGLAAETILTLWSNAQCPRLNCKDLTFSIKLANKPNIQNFVAWLRELPMLDSAYWLSSAYAIWSGEDYRKNLAMFFTPSSITRRLLDDLEHAGVSFADHSFFDPACGGAAFLAPIAERMRSALLAHGATSRQILDEVEQRLGGVELDAVLCKMSRHFLRMVLAVEIADAQFEPEFRITQANSLTEMNIFAGTFDVVESPRVSWRLIGLSQATAVASSASCL